MTKINYPFAVVYNIIYDDKDDWRIYPRYDDNWTDGAHHTIRQDRYGKWHDVSGVTYDGPETYEWKPGDPEDRECLPIEPYTANYYTKDGQLYCPNSHTASYSAYPYPACSNQDCPFLRYRQHAYCSGIPFTDEVKQKYVPMKITVDGEPFRNPYKRKD